MSQPFYFVQHNYDLNMDLDLHTHDSWTLNAPEL